MRTTLDLVRDGLSAINMAMDQMQQAQEQLSTGKALQAPSDNPSAAARVVGEYSQLSSIDSYTRANDAVSARQSAADSVLTDVIDKLTSAITTTTGAQGTTATQPVRDAAASALQGLRDALAGDINSKVQGSSLFAGGQVDQTAYTLVGGTWTYQGDNAPVSIQIDQGRQVSQSWDGQAIFQGGASNNVLNVLDQLTTAVQAGDQTGIANGLAELQNAFTRATTAQSALGADENSVSDARSRLSDLKLATETRRSQDEDANLVDAATRMNQAQVAYRAAIGAVSIMNQASLIDFIK